MFRNPQKIARRFAKVKLDIIFNKILKLLYFKVDCFPQNPQICNVRRAVKTPEGVRNDQKVIDHSNLPH